MPRVCLPAHTPDDWRPLLARPDLHWTSGRSAHALAHAWQTAAATPGGLPPEVRAVLAQHPAFADAHALLVVPEHVTPLPGGGAGSHTDALVLARATDGLAVIAVEAKVDEPFGPTVAEWVVEESDGKEERLAYVLDVLALDHAPGGVRYQLLHRTAAALLEADAFAAAHAVVLVHAFGDAPTPAELNDYQALLALFGTEARPGELATVERDGRRLHFGWAQGTAAPNVAPGDRLAERVAAILGGPVDEHDSSLLTYGDPVEVIVRADARAVHVEVPAVEWHGHTPVLAGERRESFPREAIGRLGAETRFVHAVLAARAERLRRYRACAECGARRPPEAMYDAVLCSACAERQGAGY